MSAHGDHVEAVRAALDDYSTWERNRGRLHQADVEGGVSSSDWQASDDAAVDLLHEFAALLGGAG